MSESRSTEQQRPEQPIERPTWRFSGRRGTPVHLRDQAPATLPREIQDAIVQMARERSGEKPAAGDTRAAAPRAARPSMGLGEQSAPAHEPAQAPPVAGAPMPVERRSPRPEAAAPSAPTIIGTATPPPATSESTIDIDAEAPVARTESTTEPIAAAAPAPEASTDSTPDSTASPTPAPAKPKRASKSRAKARAKARAKRAKEQAKQQAKQQRSGPAILAGDQDVPVTDPTELAVEPPLAQVAPPSDAAVPVEVPPPTTATEPVDEQPVAATSDLTGFLEDSNVWAPIPPQPDAEQVREVSALLASPSGGREHARQGAWELGRLPILLHPPIDIPAPRAARDTQPAVLDIPAANEPIVLGEVAPEPALELAPAPEPETAPIPEPEPAPALASDRELEPAVLRPIDWAPLPARLEPNPILDDELEPTAVPAAIERLTTPLPTRGPGSVSRAHARTGGDGDDEPVRAPALRASDARHHVGRRRTDLDEVIRSLSSLTRH